MQAQNRETGRKPKFRNKLRCLLVFVGSKTLEMAMGLFSGNPKQHKFGDQEKNMNKLFTLAVVSVLFGTGIVGCSNTAEGAKDDAAQNTAAVEKGAAVAVDKTVDGTHKAVVATETGVANAAAATKDAADKAVAGTEKAVATAADATKDAADKAVVGTEKAVASAGQVATHAGKVVTITPTVKAALLRDNTLYPSGNANLNDINVDTDSDGQTIHLKGTVKTNDMKKKAAQIAADSVKDKGTFKISNELTVGAH